VKTTKYTLLVLSLHLETVSRKLALSTLDGINSECERTRLQIVSIASDSEARHGASFNFLTFLRKLSTDSPIYQMLSPLRFMDFHVGDDGLTCNKDWKHIFKRF
jgi:hypothetical protein